MLRVITRLLILLAFLGPPDGTVAAASSEEDRRNKSVGQPRAGRRSVFVAPPKRRGERDLPRKPLPPPMVELRRLGKIAANYGPMNFNKWLAHPERRDLVLAGRHYEVMPVTAQIAPTTACEAKCPSCSYGGDKDDRRALAAGTGRQPEQQVMSYDEMRLYIDRLTAGGVKAALFTGGGEPMLNKNTERGMAYAKSKGLAVALFTDGFALTRKRAKQVIAADPAFVRVSINAGSQDTYQHFFGTDERGFGRAVQNIRHLARAKLSSGRDVHLGLGVIITPVNVDDLLNVAKVAESINRDFPGAIDALSYRPTVRYQRGCQFTPATEASLEYVRQHPQLSRHYEEYRGFLHQGKQFSASFVEEAMERLRNEVAPYMERHSPEITLSLPEGRLKGVTERQKPFSECTASPWVTFVGPDGGVYHCVELALDPRTSYGNLKHSTLEQIWRGKRRHEVIEMINHDGLEQLCPPVCLAYDYNTVFEHIRRAQADSGLTTKLAAWLAESERALDPGPGGTLSDMAKFM